MNKAAEISHWSNPRRMAIIGGIALVVAFTGGFIGHSLAPKGPQPQAEGRAQPRRPIVQIVRPQPGLPSLADMIASVCPSIAMIVPGRASADPVQAPVRALAAAPAFVVSADGWLVTSASLKSTAHMHAVFGDGRQADISRIRTDPVSGLAIAKVAATGLTPITLADQAFPRVGDFGFALETPHANGCTSEIAMIASDFLADGGGPVSYVRTQSAGPAIPAAAPFINSDGLAVAVAISDPAVPDAMIPAAIASIVIDELIRKSPSPSVAFGFRAADFSPTLADRVSNARLRGAGVAIVQRGSTADKAGLHAGDVVVAVGDSPVSSASELGRALDATEKQATLEVVRGSQRLTFTISRGNGKH